jgi:hypothetical protein
MKAGAESETGLGWGTAEARIWETGAEPERFGGKSGAEPEQFGGGKWCKIGETGAESEGFGAGQGRGKDLGNTVRNRFGAGLWRRQVVNRC